MESVKTIIDKLNLNKYKAKLILNKPDDIHEFDALEYDQEVKKQTYDLIFLFVFGMDEINTYLETIKANNLVNKKGYVYLAYPKKGNPQYEQSIHRDEIYNQAYYDEEGYLHGSDLKFSRMVSFNDVFTVIGIKHEPRKEKQSTKSSQCVADYVERVDDLKQALKKSPEVLYIYESLTPGYQHDWARYVFSAKRVETQTKRLNEMKEVLQLGFKTLDLYRMKKK
jgi:hypothetical protein